MRSPGINGEGELRGQPANPGSPGKMAVKTECVCMCVYNIVAWMDEYGNYNIYIQCKCTVLRRFGQTEPHAV